MGSYVIVWNTYIVRRMIFLMQLKLCVDIHRYIACKCACAYSITCLFLNQLSIVCVHLCQLPRLLKTIYIAIFLTNYVKNMYKYPLNNTVLVGFCVGGSKRNHTLYAIKYHVYCIANMAQGSESTVELLTAAVNNPSRL